MLPKGRLSSFLRGIAIGGGLLAVSIIVLSALSWLLPVGETARLRTLAIIATAVASSEVVGGWHRRLAFRWLVPTEIVNGVGLEGAKVWGRSLGFGFLTDAPYGIFHVAMVWPIVGGSPVLALAVVSAFAVARSIPYTVPAVLRNAQRIGDITLFGKGFATSAARALSAVLLLLSAVALWIGLL